MSTYHGHDEIVMVPVPRSQLRAVYAVLANPPAEQGAPEQVEEEIKVYRQGSWTKTKVIRLESQLKNPGIRALLTLVAEQAPAELTFEAAVQATGIETNLLRAQLGSLSKIAKRLFDVPYWPMEVRYAEGGEAIYSMDPKIAEWWFEATGQRP